MIKKISGFLSFALLCFMLYPASVLLSMFFPVYLQNYINGLGVGISLTLFLIGITYKKLWSGKTIEHPAKKTLFVSLTILFAMVIIPAFVLTLGYVNQLYRYIVTDESVALIGSPIVPDDTLGFKHSPKSLGWLTVPNGRTTVMHSSKEGFRVPVGGSTSLDTNGHADIIFFGCSYTYGYGVNAEESFAYLVAQKARLAYINAGVCSYGLSQMYVLANRLIPKYKPKYVVFQYSPWLIERGVSLFAPFSIGLTPGPYFSKRGNKIELQPPVFVRNIHFDRKTLREKYRNNYLGFVFNVGISYCVIDYVHLIQIKLKQILGSSFTPATEKDAVEKYVYNEMAQVAIAYGAQVIILDLGDDEYSIKSKNLFDKKYPVRFAEADSMMHDYVLSSPSHDYAKEFWQWGYDGKDSMMVDIHPNAKAQSIIAESILLKLR